MLSILLLNEKASALLQGGIDSAFLKFSNSPFLKLECSFAHSIHAEAVPFLVPNQMFSTA